MFICARKHVVCSGYDLFGAPSQNGKIHYASHVQLLKKLSNEIKEPNETLFYATLTKCMVMRCRVILVCERIVASGFV
eukprot:5213881-Karenia_brevis.AAC.1